MVEKLRKYIHQALRAWHQTDGTEENLLEDLLLVQRERSISNSPSRRLATNMVLARGIDLLSQRDPEGSKVLRARFQDRMIVQGVANQFNWTIDHVNRLQRKAIEQLSDILWEEEEEVRQQWIADWESRLPPATYSELVGVDETLDLMTSCLTERGERANVVALCGIGGIGKTSLAHAATRELITQMAFEAFVWLRVDPAKLAQSFVTAHDIVEWVTEDLARQLVPDSIAQDRSEQQRQLRQVLNAKPHLIVLDNFESHADISLLLAYLLDWAGTSKFLLTTRARPVNTDETFIIALSELGEMQSAELIRTYAHAIHLPALAQATAEQTTEIYAVVGGNPLALRLVVSLAAIMPLPHILGDLTKYKQGKTDEMYRHIYFQSWKALSENAKNLLQATALVTEGGGSVTHLQRISQLDEDAFWSAIPELVSRSLLEVRGTPWERRYGCHRLTRTFLRRDILGWNDEVE